MNELIAWAVAALAAVGGAFLMGRKSGAAKQVKKEYDMMREAKSIRDKHETKSYDDIRADAASRLRDTTK